MAKIASLNMASRPHFFDDPVSDELAAMLLALTAEVAVVYDRLDTVERLLEKTGVLERSKVEAYRPNEQVATERKKRHSEYLARVFRILRMQTEPGSEFVRFDEMTEYKDLMKKVRSEG